MMTKTTVSDEPRAGDSDNDRERTSARRQGRRPKVLESLNVLTFICAPMRDHLSRTVDDLAQYESGGGFSRRDLSAAAGVVPAAGGSLPGVRGMALGMGA